MTLEQVLWLVKSEELRQDDGKNEVEDMPYEGDNEDIKGLVDEANNFDNKNLIDSTKKVKDLLKDFEDGKDPDAWEDVTSEILNEINYKEDKEH